MRNVGILDLDDLRPLGYIVGGKFFLLGESGPVSIDRFNVVCGADMGNGVTATFSITDNEEEQ